MLYWLYLQVLYQIQRMKLRNSTEQWKKIKKVFYSYFFLFANVITITVLCVINAKSKIEYLAFSAIIFRKILDTFLEKYS